MNAAAAAVIVVVVVVVVVVLLLLLLLLLFLLLLLVVVVAAFMAANLDVVVCLVGCVCFCFLLVVCFDPDADPPSLGEALLAGCLRHLGVPASLGPTSFLEGYDSRTMS